MSMQATSVLSYPIMPIPTHFSIDLYRDGSWVGNCVIRDQLIADCYAIQLGLNGPETDEILASILAAIEQGQSLVNWRGFRFTWKFSHQSVR